MSASGRIWIALGALLGGLGVIAGAFGAHGLAGRLSAEQLATFEVAVRYQMYHALALVLVGLLSQRGSRCLAVAGPMFVTGIVLFSGCLYAWIFTGVKTWAMIVPVGGVAFILGWFALCLNAVCSATSRGGDKESG
jgi:uncharacterized membrane protein YgdD (TMEM256/DUF423 family)